MKEFITIIDTYAPTSDKQKLLVDCIESCRKLGSDILLVSHCTLPERIVNMVDYHIFDRDNRFNIMHAYAWKTVGNLTVNLRIGESHEFPIIRSMRNAFSLAHGLGYKNFYFTEFDHNFSDSDLSKIRTLAEKMVSEGKNFVFFRPLDASWIIDEITVVGVYYETSFFMGKTKPFVERFNEYFPFTLEEYNATYPLMLDNKPACLEGLFYDAFHQYTDMSIVVEQYAKSYFDDSNINMSSYKSTTCKILPSNDSKYYLYISNDNMDEFTFTVYFDDTLVDTSSLCNTNIAQSFKLLELKNSVKIRVDVCATGNNITTHNVEFDVQNTSAYSLNGSVVFENV